MVNLLPEKEKIKTKSKHITLFVAAFAVFVIGIAVVIFLLNQSTIVKPILKEKLQKLKYEPRFEINR